MNAIQHAIALPPDEVVVDRAVRRKILRKVAPLATGAQDIHDVVSTDIVNRGFGTSGIDFLKESTPRAKHIMTNPPGFSGSCSTCHRLAIHTGTYNHTRRTDRANR